MKTRDFDLEGEVYSLLKFREKIEKEALGPEKGQAFFASNVKVTDQEFDWEQINWRPVWATKIVWYKKWRI